MITLRSVVTGVSLSLLLAVPLAAQSADRLDARNVKVAPADFKGRPAVQVLAMGRCARSRPGSRP